MQPVLNQILFKPFASDETSELGLFIPDNAREPNDRGVICMVGNGTSKRPMNLKKGQIAHRVHAWGEPIWVNNELHFIMDAKAIIAVE